MNFKPLQLYLAVLCYVELCRGQAPDAAQWWTVVATTVPHTGDPDLEPFYVDPADDSTVCCVCVPFYLCDDNKSIIVDGGNIIAPRLGPAVQNVETCPDDTQLCCRPPTAMVDCQVNKTALQVNPVIPNPNAPPCECTHWEFCPEEMRVSDGSSPTTLIDNRTPLERHSKCPHSLEVCCTFDIIPIVTSSGPPAPTAPPVPPAGGDCVCVNPWLCGKDGFIITDGIGSMDMRVMAPDDLPCVPPRVCCRVPVDGVTPPTTVLPPRVITTPMPITEDQRCSGIRNRKGVSVRIGGFKHGESQFGEFPWVGMVLRTYVVAGAPMNAFIGGAILIHPRVILTAAHKVANEAVASLSVRVGEWDIETAYEPGAHQVRSVESVIIHPNFNNRTLYHDVALLILTERVVLHPHIRSICLATTADEVDQNACVANGWGEDSFDTGNYQTVMKSVTLPLVPSTRCQALLRRTRVGKWFQLHQSFICAGGEAGKDTCTSDGGGPLACPRIGSTTEYLLVGITAWGIGCGEKGVPGVYASTMADNRWITAQVEGKFPSHSAVRRQVFNGAGGELGVEGINFWDQGQQNRTKGESTRCRPDARDCLPAAAALLPSATQPTTTTLSTIAPTTQAASTTTESSGRGRRLNRGQRQQQQQQQQLLLEALRRKQERQRRRTERERKRRRTERKRRRTERQRRRTERQRRRTEREEGKDRARN